MRPLTERPAAERTKFAVGGPLGVPEGSVALVTGAGRGIGQAVARRLAQAGYRVVVSDRAGKMAEDTAQQIRQETEVDCVARELDVTDRGGVNAAVDDVVASWGRIDLAVNNAMWIRYAALHDITEGDVERMLDVGVKGPLWVCESVTRSMADHGGGSIVNIASMAAYLGTKGAAVYSAVKGAVVSLTQQLAFELGPLNIRVNAIAPGTIETPGSLAAMSEQSRVYRVERAPLGRLGRPEDIAEAVLYLGGPSSSFVTGQVLKMDGGISVAM